MPPSQIIMETKTNYLFKRSAQLYDLRQNSVSGRSFANGQSDVRLSYMHAHKCKK